VTRPEAVLLDVGGVFLLPEHDRIAAALRRAECEVDAEVLDAAHYRGATKFVVDLDVEGDWAGCWRGYLEDYLVECGVPEDFLEEAHRHVDSEFADAALWLRVIPGCREGLQALADTGVRLGIISNADARLKRCRWAEGIGRGFPRPARANPATKPPGEGYAAAMRDARSPRESTRS
jgi:FMN phosphatase YigB (HAD superfamily)